LCTVRTFTNFGVDRSTVFLLEPEHTDRQTERQTDRQTVMNATDHPTHGSALAGVVMNIDMK